MDNEESGQPKIPRTGPDSIPVGAGITVMTMNTDREMRSFRKGGNAQLGSVSPHPSELPESTTHDVPEPAIHVIKRSILGRLLGVSPDQLRFSLGRFGKPMLTDASSFAFNISHASPVAALAIVKGSAVGIDIEIEGVRPTDPFLAAARFFTREESAWASEENSMSEARRRFLKIWVIKEAISKALGYGLAMNWQDIQIDMDALHGNSSDSISLRGIYDGSIENWSGELVKTEDDTWLAWVGSSAESSTIQYIRINADLCWEPMRIAERFSISKIAVRA